MSAAWGSLVGAIAGALAGAGAGSAAEPGGGTAVGFLIGMFGGAVAGNVVGKKLFSPVAKAEMHCRGDVCLKDRPAGTLAALCGRWNTCHRLHVSCGTCGRPRTRASVSVRGRSVCWNARLDRRRPRTEGPGHEGRPGGPTGHVRSVKGVGSAVSELWPEREAEEKNRPLLQLHHGHVGALAGFQAQVEGPQGPAGLTAQWAASTTNG